MKNEVQEIKEKIIITEKNNQCREWYWGNSIWTIWYTRSLSINQISYSNVSYHRSGNNIQLCSKICLGNWAKILEQSYQTIYHLPSSVNSSTPHASASIQSMYPNYLFILMKFSLSLSIFPIYKNLFFNF